MSLLPDQALSLPTVTPGLPSLPKAALNVTTQGAQTTGFSFAEFLVNLDQGTEKEEVPSEEALTEVSEVEDAAQAEEADDTIAIMPGSDPEELSEEQPLPRYDLGKNAQNNQGGGTALPINAQPAGEAPVIGDGKGSLAQPPLPENTVVEDNLRPNVQQMQSVGTELIQATRLPPKENMSSSMQVRSSGVASPGPVLAMPQPQMAAKPQPSVLDFSRANSPAAQGSALATPPVQPLLIETKPQIPQTTSLTSIPREVSESNEWAKPPPPVAVPTVRSNGRTEEVFRSELAAHSTGGSYSREAAAATAPILPDIQTRADNRTTKAPVTLPPVAGFSLSPSTPLPLFAEPSETIPETELAKSVAPFANAPLAPQHSTGLNAPDARMILSPANINRVSDALITLRDTGGQIDVALSPDDVGRLTIKLEQSAQGLQFVLTAERSDTQDIMRRHMEHLHQQFRAMGFENATFSFGEQHHGGGQTPPSQQGSATGKHPTGEGAQTVLVRALSSNSSVDIRI